MFAIVQTGGKQYRAQTGALLRVEKLPGEKGDIVRLDSVLMLAEEGKAPILGAPFIKGALVRAEIVEQERDQKILVFKKKRRKNYRRARGHRQDQSLLRVMEIKKSGGA